MALIKRIALFFWCLLGHTWVTVYPNFKNPKVKLLMEQNPSVLLWPVGEECVFCKKQVLSEMVGHLAQEE